MKYVISVAFRKYTYVVEMVVRIGDADTSKELCLQAIFNRILEVQKLAQSDGNIDCLMPIEIKIWKIVDAK